VPQCHACAGRIGKFRFALSPPPAAKAMPSLQRGGRTERHALSSPIATPKATVDRRAKFDGVPRWGVCRGCRPSPPPDASSDLDRLSRVRTARRRPIQPRTHRPPPRHVEGTASTQGEATLPQQTGPHSCRRSNQCARWYRRSRAAVRASVSCGEMRRIEREQDALPSGSATPSCAIQSLHAEERAPRGEFPLAPRPEPHQQVERLSFLQRYKREAAGRLVLTVPTGVRDQAALASRCRNSAAGNRGRHRLSAAGAAASATPALTAPPHQARLSAPVAVHRPATTGPATSAATRSASPTRTGLCHAAQSRPHGRQRPRSRPAAGEDPLGRAAQRHWSAYVGASAPRQRRRQATPPPGPDRTVPSAEAGAQLPACNVSAVLRYPSRYLAAIRAVAAPCPRSAQRRTPVTFKLPELPCL